MVELQRFTEKFTDKEMENVRMIKGREHQVTPEIIQILDQLHEEIYSAGLPLQTHDRRFTPSAFLLETLSKNSNNKVAINDKAEWLFLCGRDVFVENVMKNNSRGEFFLVQNSRDENLGLGKLEIKDGKKIIKNIFDRGDFLRRER